MDVREKLLSAALRVFQETGSRGATTRRIAAEAGVNEITLFRRFGSKQALLSEALQTAARQEIGTALPREPADPEAELVAWCRARMEHLRHARSMIRTCMAEMEKDPGIARCAGATPRLLAAELERYLERLRERGMASPDLDPGPAAALLMGALFSDVMGRDLMPERYDYTPDEAPGKYVRLFLRAIGHQPAPAPAPKAVSA